MSIDLWGVGLQAINVLILVWLLSRVFWRPVAQAIAARQETALAMNKEAKSAQDKADLALEEVNKDRENMAAERDAFLKETNEKAEASTKVILKEASKKAEKLLKAARVAAEKETDATRTKNAEDAAQLGVEIAGKLLARLDIIALQSSFLDFLIDAIEQMKPSDRGTLAKMKDSLDLVSAVELDKAAKTEVSKAVHKALGGTPELNFVFDAKLIAGYELHSSHLVLHNSWSADLAAILKDLKNAA